MVCDGNSRDTGPISCPRITLDWPSALVCGDVKRKKEGFQLETWELTLTYKGVVGQVRWGAGGRAGAVKIGIPRALPHCPCRLESWRQTNRPTTPKRAPTKGKSVPLLLLGSAGGAGWMLAEHIWKRKRDNRPNECAGDNSSSSGRVISSLWFNMMIDHLCPPTLS